MAFREEILRLLTQPELPAESYYHVAVVARPGGPVQWAVQTTWCDFTDDKPRREIREGRLFYGEAQRAWLHKGGELALLINDREDLKYFYAFGGHALVVKAVAEEKFAHLIARQVCHRDSSGFGFVLSAGLSEAQIQHAPTKKLRMEILTRDGRRCLICGRSPAYYVDVELHVHHALPLGDGGVTEEANLITICKTCHDGLDPHWDMGLVGLLREKYPDSSTKYFQEVQDYQQWVRGGLKEAT